MSSKAIGGQVAGADDGSRSAASIAIDALTTIRAWAVSRLVDVARRAGKADAAAESELAKLKSLIAEEDRPTTVPLVVDPPARRDDSKAS